MESSNDDSNESGGAKILDLRDRLPAHIFGDNPTGELAGKVFKLILDEGGPAPHVWFAALMATSYAYQRLLKTVYGVEFERLQAIFNKAQEEADSMNINVVPKTELRGV